MAKVMTLKDFIEKSSKKHNNKYDYSEVEYKGSHENVKIICTTHGSFVQIANNHVHGKGCSKCAKNGVLLTTNEFIAKAKEIHSHTYDYSKVVYQRSKNKIEIICKVHGVFKQMPYAHLGGAGCPKCYRDSRRSNTSDFINKSKAIHGDTYNYDLTNFKNDKTNVIITCKNHGDFEQRPDTHKKGSGCPICSNSKGEKTISDFLSIHKIEFVSGKMFDDCIFKRRLKFDFFIPSHNLCIEYDGEQHFVPIDCFGGKPKLKITQKRDKTKDEYCHKNNIHLLRISYKENVVEKLKKHFKI